MIPVMDSGQQKSFTESTDIVPANLAECQSCLPLRAEDAHKGSSGRVLIVGGEDSMAGASCLAGWASYIAGAGLVRVATKAANVAPITSCRPELLVSGIAEASQLSNLLRQVDVVALGPGLGQTKWSRQVFEYCLEHSKPDLIDADALNLLAQTPDKRDNWVLTPHMAEAARLLNSRVAEVQANRIAAAHEIVSIYGGICILKGKGSLIISDEQASICPYGNASLAVAGTGDVLTGLLSGLLAQGMETYQATVSGVVLHACAADIHAQQYGKIGMLASDLMLPLRQLRNGQEMKDEG